MNAGKIKIILLALSSFGAGATVGYFYADKKLRELYDAEVEDVKTHYSEKLEELGVMPKDWKPEESRDIEPDCSVYEGLSEDEVDDIIKFNGLLERENTVFGKNTALAGAEVLKSGQKGRRPVMNYSNPPMGDVLKTYSSEEYDLTEEEEIDPEEMDATMLDLEAEDWARRRALAKENQWPYVVSYEEAQDIITERGPEFDVIDLLYYTEDRVMTEDNDLELDEDESERAVGYDFEDLLAAQSSCYVMNDELDALYHIHRVQGRFDELVGSLVETPTERSTRIWRRNREFRRV